MLGKKFFNSIAVTVTLSLCLLLIADQCVPVVKAQSVSDLNASVSSSARPEDAESNGWSEEDVQTYVTVMDRKVVADIFGSRISKRFIAFQVTVENLNRNLQFLVHDISLDLEKVFNAPEAGGQSPTVAGNSSGGSKSEKLRYAPLYQPTEPATRAGLNRPELKPAGRRSNMYMYRLSSIENSLIRGVAEKGQGQDKRNLMLRMLRGTGSLAAALMGVTTLGVSYAPAVAAFNGPGLTTYADVFPDYTINQLNRLNDSGYRANTLIPKQQSKVIVAFIPQAIFLTETQRKIFGKDPLELTKAENGRVDFRRAEAIVNGSFIVEMNKQPPSITTGKIDTTDPKIFQSAQPVLKGHLVGNFPPNTDIKRADSQSDFSVVKDADSTDTELKFTITSNKPVKPSQSFNLEVFNPSGRQTFAVSPEFSVERPTVNDPVPNEVAQPAQTVDKEFTVKGTNFFADIGASDVIVEPSESGVQVSKVTYVSPTEIKVTLKIDKGAATGERRIRVSNPAGLSLEGGKLNIKASSENNH